MIKVRYSGGNFTKIEPPAAPAVEGSAPAISPAEISKQAGADAVEKISHCELDGETLRLKVTFRRSG